jgi:DNA ligase D-like protein (predicted ligase)
VPTAESAGRRRLPAAIEPMLTRIGKPFDSTEHSFEIKWDGTRCIALIDGDGLRLHNRRGIEMRERYPELAGLAKLPAGCVLDGEIVVLRDGKPSFSHLMQREHLADARRIAAARKRLPATLMVFDLLYLEYESIMKRPLVERREKLAALARGAADGHVVLPDWVVGSGIKYYEAVTGLGLEGIIAKRLDSGYEPGRRSHDWLKIKREQFREFEIVGFLEQDAGGSLKAFMLAERVAGRLVYRGRVGGGFTDRQRREFFELVRDARPLAAPPANGPKEGVWKLTGRTCRVRFLEETPDGMLRAPVFQGLVEE